MLPHFPAGTRNWETGSKRKEKQGKEEFLRKMQPRPHNAIVNEIITPFAESLANHTDAETKIVAATLNVSCGRGFTARRVTKDNAAFVPMVNLY